MIRVCETRFAISLGRDPATGISSDSSQVEALWLPVANHVNRGYSRTPRSEIIVMLYYNPVYVVAPTTDLLLAQLNGVIASAAAPYGVRLANAFAVINQNPTFPSEGAAVCALTGMCSPPPGGDIHANDLGYALIGTQFWAASGYGQLDQ